LKKVGKNSYSPSFHHLLYFVIILGTSPLFFNNGGEDKLFIEYNKEKIMLKKIPLRHPHPTTPKQHRQEKF